MIALRPPRDARREEFRADIRGYRNLVLVLLANGLACWLIAQVVGGSALLGEVPHHQPPFIEMDGERVVVSSWLYEFSFWHGFSVSISVLWVLVFGLLVFGEHGLAWLRKRARSRKSARA